MPREFASPMCFLCPSYGPAYLVLAHGCVVWYSRVRAVLHTPSCGAYLALASFHCQVKRRLPTSGPCCLHALTGTVEDEQPHACKPVPLRCVVQRGHADLVRRGFIGRSTAVDCHLRHPLQEGLKGLCVIIPAAARKRHARRYPTLVTVQVSGNESVSYEHAAEPAHRPAQCADSNGPMYAPQLCTPGSPPELFRVARLLLQRGKSLLRAICRGRDTHGFTEASVQARHQQCQMALGL